MAGFRSINGSGYGNPYVDALVWGGQVWDMTDEPIMVFIGGGSLENDDADYAEAEWVHGPSPLMSASAHRESWDDASVEALVSILDLYSSVANIRFAPAQTVSDANIVWWWSGLPENVTGAHETPDGFQTHQRLGDLQLGFSRSHG